MGIYLEKVDFDPIIYQTQQVKEHRDKENEEKGKCNGGILSSPDLGEEEVFLRTVIVADKKSPQDRERRQRGYSKKTIGVAKNG